MADVGIEQLKEDIQDNIKTNNSQAITGAVLQGQLIDTVDTLKGYTDDHVSVSQNTETGHTDITVGSTITSVGSVQDVDDIDFALGLSSKVAQMTLDVGSLFQGSIDHATKFILCSANYIKVFPNIMLKLIHDSDITIRVAEYSENKTFIRDSGSYSDINSLLLGNTTRYIRIAGNYSAKGYSNVNPVTIEDYTDGDFGVIVPEITNIDDTPTQGSNLPAKSGGIFDFVSEREHLNICVSDALNNTTDNITVDSENKKVVINKNGFVLKIGNKYYSVYDDNDAELSYDTADAPNGAYVILKTAFSNSNGTQIVFSNIVYAAKGSENYLNGLALFHCYYGYLIPAGAFETVIGFRQSINDIKRNTFILPYYSETLADASSSFISHISENDIDTFIFFTDPHIMGVSGTWDMDYVVKYISPIEKCYNRLPVDMIISGGDWLNSGDTVEQAKRKLGFVDAMMRKKFNNYYPMNGNHDVNDQTEGEALSQGLINNLMFRQEGSAFYYFNTRFAKWYILDSGSIVSQALNPYRYMQLHWFANELLQNTNEHIIVGLHAYKQPGELNPFPFANNVRKIVDAFNTKSTITIWNPATQRDVTYDYTNVTGKVAAIMAGHAHSDDLLYTESNIPVVVTTWLRDNNIPSFDLDVIDWTLGKLITARVGTGSNRTIDIII